MEKYCIVSVSTEEFDDDIIIETWHMKKCDDEKALQNKPKVM